MAREYYFCTMHYIEYLLFRFLFAIFGRISYSSGKRIANLIHFLIAHVFRYRRKVIIANLRLVYGDQLPMPLPRLLDSIYRNFVYLWCEFLQLSRLKKEEFDQHFTIYGKKLIDKELGQGNGVIYLSGHYGNFEWLGQFYALLGYPVNGIAQRQSNRLVNDFIEKLRQSKGARVIYKKEAMKKGLEVLRRGELCAIIADQDARKRGVFVNFMGHPASTPVGPAILQMRSGMPIYMIISVRKDYGQFEAFIEPVYDGPEREITDSEIKKITQSYTANLEKWVRKYPDQWFWMHKRWKTKQPKV